VSRGGGGGGKKPRDRTTRGRGRARAEEMGEDVMPPAAPAVPASLAGAAVVGGDDAAGEGARGKRRKPRSGRG